MRQTGAVTGGKPVRQCIIDTDCGIDDAAALLMALGDPDTEILGITTVAGNVDLAHVERNVLRLLSYVGRPDIPVFRGAARALRQHPTRAESIHGPDGLGGVELPDTEKKIEKISAPEAFRDLARTHSGCTLVTLGPLTNLAVSLVLFPEIAGMFERVISMGGAVKTGNVTAYAEFNYYADPEAVQVVLDSGIPLSVVPWDACFPLRFTEAELYGLGLAGTRGGDIFLRTQDWIFDFTEKAWGERVSSLPDPVAMAYYLDPGAAARKMRTGLKMELAPTMLRGASVTTEGQDVEVIMELDRDRFTRSLAHIKRL
jgi:purine nucleosidase